MNTKKMKRSGLVVLAALLSATAFTTSSQAWFRVGGCFACGGRAFAAGAIAGAAIARPIYYPPRYVYPVPAYPVYPPYATCPLVAPVPYYCR
jgi:hypothetical protein